MAGTFPALVLLVAVAAAVSLGGLTYVSLNRPHLRIAERAKAEADATLERTLTVENNERGSVFTPVIRVMSRIADHLPIYDAAQRAKFSRSLLSAGIRHPMALRIFIVGKLGFGLLCAVIAAFALNAFPDLENVFYKMIAVFGGLFVGLILPEMGLDWVVKKRRAAIHQALPDVLDLMVICTNAGYSLSATLRRVSTEFAPISKPLADELAITADDISLRADPMAGLRNLADRTGIPALSAMVTTLIQSQRYGTPITHALKTLAKSERRARVLAMEEKGAKLSTKITIPMMILILPAVLILAGGPAFLRVMEVFGK
ncbi:type II secretion system F family protein [Magnetospirillum fulvum]|uniref:Type II secretion system protein F domain-containing protein n=1 Tax=Magnetospirillum fulvum MGU-K5 TaxID=1316936 RepID=S9TRI2_MAGFU|nr:type II secretion system F family protein [Magnetospirillum fulvum]EPY01125.1 type II secretion system protein F domain-containing protein [Magnetospirillum fulvum MGU-K5]